MRRPITVLSALVAAAALVLGATPAAEAKPARSLIVGGSVAKGTPWVVQVRDTAGGSLGTGVQVSASWVLTARHVQADGFRGYIAYGNNVNNPTHRHRVDRTIHAPKGDVALLHLAHPSPLKDHHYAKLDLHYQIRSHGIARILGFGDKAVKGTEFPKHLRQARVRLAGRHADAYGGVAQSSYPKTGRVAGGDSGGPMLVNGRVVGVSSLLVGKHHADSRYAILSQGDDASWIRQHAHL